ncbi:MAG: PH domain-containing protein, partial [Candidatus Methanofastidiosia archaeon]
MLKEDLSKLVDLLDSEEVIHIFKSNFRDDDVGFFGFLVFSNRRLIFIEERGDFVKSYHALKLVPFEEIAEIEVEKFKWEKTMAVAEKSGKKNFFYNIKE